jgi:oxygen-independent coproporphyrinogen-3 oxidase
MIIRFAAPGPWWARGVHLLRLLPQAEVKVKADNWDLDVRVEDRRQALQISVFGEGISEQAIVPAEKSAFLHTLFQVLSNIQGAPLSPWGILTGVRPGKVASRLLNSLGREGARAELCSKWLLSPDKADLLLAAVANGHPLLKERGISIYISVPFCPSRCHYCSFASLPLGRWQKQLETYVAQASQELSELLAACRHYQIPVNSIYVGGGTPTSLEPGQLQALLAPAARPGCEFTVEAGRPDTLSQEHLRVMEGLGVTRISINSQYPRAETLREIGREHSVEQFYSALDLTVRSGIPIINSDLIIGLPGQEPEEFAQVVTDLVDRGVQNITIHAMALKRGAATRRHYLEADEARAIAQAAYARLEELGFVPYYLYRQKNIASHLENVGFALPGTFCYYNIASIAETEPVLGVGAGAVSKLVSHNSIETLNNPRDPNQYLERRATLVRRKLDWLRRGS